MTDVILASDGDVAADWLFLTDPLAVHAQRLQTRLRTFFGEWFLDQRIGLPFIAWKGQKPPRVAAIGSRVLSEIRATPGVVAVIDYVTDYSNVSMVLSITGVVRTSAGDLRLVFDALDDGLGNQIIDLQLNGPLGPLGGA